GGPPPWWSQFPRAPALRRARRRAPRRRATDVAPAPAVCLAPERLAGEMVGVTGFEPAAPASRTQCSTRLSYTPCKADQRVRARLTQALRQEKLAASGCNGVLRRDVSAPLAGSEFPPYRRGRRLARRLPLAGCERRRRGAKGGGDAADHESGGGGAPLRAHAGRDGARRRRRRGRAARLPGLLLSRRAARGWSRRSRAIQRWRSRRRARQRPQVQEEGPKAGWRGGCEREGGVSERQARPPAHG